MKTEETIRRVREALDGLTATRGTLLDLLAILEDNRALRDEVERLRFRLVRLEVDRPAHPSPEGEAIPVEGGAAQAPPSGGAGAEPPPCPLGMDPRDCESFPTAGECTESRCGNLALFRRAQHGSAAAMWREKIGAPPGLRCGDCASFSLMTGKCDRGHADGCGGVDFAGRP